VMFFSFWFDWWLKESVSVSQSVDIILVVWKWNIIINNNNALMKSFLVA